MKEIADNGPEIGDAYEQVAGQNTYSDKSKGGLVPFVAPLAAELLTVGAIALTTLAIVTGSSTNNAGSGYGGSGGDPGGGGGLPQAAVVQQAEQSRDPVEQSPEKSAEATSPPPTSPPPTSPPPTSPPPTSPPPTSPPPTSPPPTTPPPYYAPPQEPSDDDEEEEEEGFTEPSMGLTSAWGEAISDGIVIHFGYKVDMQSADQVNVSARASSSSYPYWDPGTYNQVFTGAGQSFNEPDLSLMGNFPTSPPSSIGTMNVTVEVEATYSGEQSGSLSGDSRNIQIVVPPEFP